MRDHGYTEYRDFVTGDYLACLNGVLAPHVSGESVRIHNVDYAVTKVDNEVVKYVNSPPLYTLNRFVYVSKK